MTKRKESGDYKYLHHDIKVAIDYMINLTDSFPKHTYTAKQSSLILPTSSSIASLPTTYSLLPELSSPLPTSSIISQIESPLPSIISESAPITTSSTTTEVASGSSNTSELIPTTTGTKLHRGRCGDCRRLMDRKVKSSCFSCQQLECREHSKQFTTSLSCESMIYFK